MNKPPRKKLPPIGRHTVIGLVAFAGLIACSEQMEDRLPDIPYRMWIVTVSFVVFFVYFLFYGFVYPFLHIFHRYRGSHSTAWIVWMVIDTLGITAGLVTVVYYTLHIIPDWFRSKFSQ